MTFKHLILIGLMSLAIVACNDDEDDISSQTVVNRGLQCAAGAQGCSANWNLNFTSGNVPAAAQIIINGITVIDECDPTVGRSDYFADRNPNRTAVFFYIKNYYNIGTGENFTFQVNDRNCANNGSTMSTFNLRQPYSVSTVNGVTSVNINL